MEMMCSNLLLSHTGSFLIKSSQKPRLQFLHRCQRAACAPNASTQPLERRAREVTCFHIPQPLFPAPSSKDFVCSQADHRGTRRRKHGTFLQSTQRNSCCDVPTRGFLAPGFVALGFIYSGSANSQDESETKKCFIKKESIII